jgi:PAS domain S-box-containing protein
MNDESKTRQQLLDELAALRSRIAHLEDAQTQYRQAAEVLRFTQFAVDRSSDAAFWMGRDARFIYVNDAACQMLGYTRQELLGLTVHHIDPHFTPDTWPVHWQEIKERGSFTLESDHCTKQGRTFPVEITVNFVEFEGQEYNCAFRAAPIGIGLVVDRVLYWTNDTLHEMIGRSAGELLGQSARILYENQQEFERVGREKYAQIDREGTGTLETRFVHKNGSVLDVLLSSTPLDPADPSAGVTFTALDITDRKRTEQALQRHAEQLEALRQVGLEIMAQLHLTDLLHSIVSRAVELLDAKSGGFYLCRPEHGILEWVVAVGPELAPVGTTLHQGEGLSGKVWESGEPLITTDYHNWSGRTGVYEGYTFGAVVGVPVRWATEFLGVLDVLADRPRTFSAQDVELLTLLAAQAAIAIKNARFFQAEQQRRREAEALRQASLVFGSTLDADQVVDQLLEQIDAVFPYDCVNVMWVQDGIARVTHQRGYEQTGTRTATAALCLSVDEIPNLKRMARTRRPHIVPDTRSDPDWVHLGPTHWIHSWAGAPIVVRDEVIAFFCLDSGTPGTYTSQHAGLLAALAAHASMAIENARLFAETQAAYDELKQAQAQLIQSAKLAAVGELAAGVAHELNNPLTSILGFAELLMWNANSDDRAQEELSIIADEARRARDIVRDLLDFSRQVESFPEKADLNRLIRETLNLLRRQIGHSGIKLAESYEPDLPLLSLAVGRMKQVFLNLVANAMQAMPYGGRLIIATKKVGGEVAVHVADTGVGIPRELMTRLFEPFFTTKPVGQGTGLGLSVSLGIVQEHGGRITVESQEGVGSRFTVWLPLNASTGDTDQ